MGRRGDNAFKRNDAIRALRSARDAGLEPVAMEVVLGPDGSVTFRIFGENTASKGTDAAGARAWDAEIEKLKGRGKG